jgi:hypothetical protein
MTAPDIRSPFRVATEATIHGPDGHLVERETATRTVDTATLTAGRYKLETPTAAAGRIARTRHMNAVVRRLGETSERHIIDVAEVSIEEMP